MSPLPSLRLIYFMAPAVERRGQFNRLAERVRGERSVGAMRTPRTGREMAMYIWCHSLPFNTNLRLESYNLILSNKVVTIG